MLAKNLQQFMMKQAEHPSHLPSENHILSRIDAMLQTGDLKDARRRFRNAQQMLWREKSLLRHILEGAGIGAAGGAGIGGIMGHSLAGVTKHRPYYGLGAGALAGGLLGGGIGAGFGAFNKLLGLGKTEDEWEMKGRVLSDRQVAKKEKKVLKEIQRRIANDPKELEDPSDEMVNYLMQQGLIQ
jgi:hypothetical protein